MCLGIPVQVISVKESDQISRPALLRRADGTEMKADLALVSGATAGDYVITHSGYAISILTEEQALEAMSLLDATRGGQM